MDEYTIRQAIDLIKAKRLTDARKLLRPVLEVTPTNEAAWVWFASTFSKPVEQLMVMRYAEQFCPKSQPLTRGIERLQSMVDEQRSRGEEDDIGNLESQLPIVQGAVIETPSSFDSSHFAWDQPFEKQDEQAQDNSSPDGDWISSLRSSAMSMPEPEEPEVPAVAPAFVEPEEVYYPAPDPAFDEVIEVETPVDPFTQPEPLEELEQEEAVTTPPWQTSMPDRPVMWNGQDIGQESVESSPFFSDMDVTNNNQSDANRRSTRSGYGNDPYQTPFWIAVVFGAFLLIILAVFVTVLMLQGGGA